MHLPLSSQHCVVSSDELRQWRLAAINCADAAEISVREVDWLLQEVSGWDRLALWRQLEVPTPGVELSCSLAELSHLWQLRVQQRIPLQYLLERVHWRHFSLRVAPGVLIPRPETELLIDMVVALLAEEVASATAASTPSGLPSHWVDLGTGSGVIALGLADALPTATTHAVDCSTAALVIARDNAQQLGLGDRIQFYHGHWWEPLSALRGQCQGMVANPPYIPSSQIAQLQPEVAWHEPHLALDGGADGLDCVRHLVTTAPEYLKSGGIWLVEVMAGQAPAVVELLRSQGSYRATQIHQDWAGIERFVSARVI